MTGGQVEITAGRRDGRPFLAVTNTGPVIPPDQLGRLFQPFQRLDPGPRVRGARAGWGSGWPSSARSRPRTAPNCAR